MSAPVDPQTAINGVAAGLSLLDRILEMVQQARAKDGPIAMAQIIARLPAEGFSLASKIRTRCEEFRAEFDGRDLDQPIKDLQKDYEFWHLKRYRLVRDFNTEIRGMTDSINNLLTDFVAIAHCRDAEHLISDSFQSIQPLKEEIDALVNSNDHVGTILDKLVNYARSLENRLGDLSGAPV